MRGAPTGPMAVGWAGWPGHPLTATLGGQFCVSRSNLAAAMSVSDRPAASSCARPALEISCAWAWLSATERAAIVLTKGHGEGDQDGDFLTVLVAPLTGKTELKIGKHAMPRPRTDEEESEREDSGF